ncbi:divalent-cation tolerance protein CutA [Desulfovibrio sp. OttesenSCG-928-A18]|nr:divalent-cation tolerance protein CutA [Desulfovibrio sp. OttesenSCG-928-A18]
MIAFREHGMQAFFVYVTAPDIQCAGKIAEALVAERLAACANILDGMESVYWWQGTLEHGKECILICKCTAERYPALEKRICELHPYDTPCIVALPIQQGYAPFMRWLEEESRPSGQ